MAGPGDRYLLPPALCLFDLYQGSRRESFCNFLTAVKAMGPGERVLPLEPCYRTLLFPPDFHVAVPTPRRTRESPAPYYDFLYTSYREEQEMTRQSDDFQGYKTRLPVHPCQPPDMKSSVYLEFYFFNFCGPPKLCYCHLYLSYLNQICFVSCVCCVFSIPSSGTAVACCCSLYTATPCVCCVQTIPHLAEYFEV